MASVEELIVKDDFSKDIQEDSELMTDTDVTNESSEIEFIEDTDYDTDLSSDGKVIGMEEKISELELEGSSKDITKDDEKALDSNVNEPVEGEGLNENERLSREAKYLMDNERLLDAAILLRKINPDSLLTAEEKEVIANAHDYITFFSVIKTFNGNPCSESTGFAHWQKIKEFKINGCLTDCFYNVEKDPVSGGTKIDIKIDSIISKSLVSSYIALLQEPDLFTEWIPQFKVPKVKLYRSELLEVSAPFSKVIALTLKLPWPLVFIEFIIGATATDDIQTNKSVGIRFRTYKTGDRNGLIPPPEPKVNRIYGNGGFMFHVPSEEYKKRAKEGGYMKEGESVDDLVQLTLLVNWDTKGFSFPESLIRFALRIMLHMAWKKIMRVAEEIRDGKRPENAAKVKKANEIWSSKLSMW